MLPSFNHQSLVQLERRCWQLHSFLGYLQQVNQGSTQECERIERLLQESDRVKYDILTAELDARLDALIES